MLKLSSLRKALTVPAAIVAVLALAWTAHAAAPSFVEVGGDATPGEHPITATNNGAITVKIGSLTATCTSANAVGKALSGPTTVGAPYLKFSDLGLTGCTGILGVGVTITYTCDALVRTTALTDVTAAITDEVDGVIDLGTAAAPCLHVETNGIACSLDIYGVTSAVLDEKVQPNGTQRLTVSGSGLKATNVTNPGCLYIINNEDAVTFSLEFDIDSENGLINIR